jgi:hypothetical protein
MLTDPFAPRNLVRKRIIRRNVNYPSMKSFYVFGTLAGLALLPVTFMVFAGMVSPWMPALPMFIMLASVGDVYPLLVQDDRSHENKHT